MTLSVYDLQYQSKNLQFTGVTVRLDSAPNSSSFPHMHLKYRIRAEMVEEVEEEREQQGVGEGE